MEMRFATLKQKNRRVTVLLAEDKDGNPGFYIETKRLLDFRTRNITTTRMGYSIETFEALFTVMNGIRNDSQYKRILNRMSKAIKADKGMLTTNTDGF